MTKRTNKPQDARQAPKFVKFERLIEQVEHQVRRMSAQSVLTSQAVSSRFGIHTTDLECLDLIFLRGRVSAGELAQATGLTSGAVTALLDRLEHAGYISRVADPDDRRRVLVQVCREAIAPIQSVYGPMQNRMYELWATYSEQELEVVIDFLSRSTELAASCTREISKGTSSTTRRSRARTASSQKKP